MGITSFLLILIIKEKKMELSDIHNCEKCQGKIVSITIDKFGITRCGYCNQVVDYADYFKYKEAERQLKV